MRKINAVKASAIAFPRGEQPHKIGSEQIWGDGLRPATLRLVPQMPEIAAVCIGFYLNVFPSPKEIQTKQFTLLPLQ
ncbi:hypothetical protein C7B67_15145, partial [filamentous cyanobacterium Phorm 6]